LEGEIQDKVQHKERLEGNISQLEDYAAALDIKEEDLIVPTLNTNPLVKDAWDAIKTELEKPIPTFGQKEWRAERRKAIKGILKDLQTALFNAKETQKEDILKLGKSLYNKAMQNVRAIIEQNKQLQKENGRLTEENSLLKNRLSQVDETAIEKLRQQKDGRISQLVSDLKAANRDTARAMSDYTQANIRANKATEQLEKMLAIPEIRDVWNNIKQRRETIIHQLDKWIAGALDAIVTYAKSGQSLFTNEQDNAVRLGIIANAYKNDLDSMDNDQRMQATHNLLEQVDWSDMTDYKIKYGKLRTEQTCQEMTVTKEVVKSLLIAAGGQGGIGIGGGGSNSELTNWDGTKKKTGWGIG